MSLAITVFNRISLTAQCLRKLPFLSPLADRPLTKHSQPKEIALRSCNVGLFICLSCITLIERGLRDFLMSYARWKKGGISNYIGEGTNCHTITFMLIVPPIVPLSILFNFVRAANNTDKLTLTQYAMPEVPYNITWLRLWVGHRYLPSPTV